MTEIDATRALSWTKTIVTRTASLSRLLVEGGKTAEEAETAVVARAAELVTADDAYVAAAAAEILAE